MNLQTGAFGDPSSTETLILFWSKMEELHYPGAGETKKYLEKRLQQEQQRAAQAQQMQIQLHELFVFVHAYFSYHRLSPFSLHTVLFYHKIVLISRGNTKNLRIPRNTQKPPFRSGSVCLNVTLPGKSGSSDVV